MADIIEQALAAINGTDTMVMAKSAEPVAWNAIPHCKSFNTPVTVSEAVKAAGADYEVVKKPLLAVSPELIHAIQHGEPITDAVFTKNDIVETHMATVRNDGGNILGIVGSKYGVVPNSEAFAFFNHILNGEVSNQKEKAVIETAGVLEEGKRMYISARMGSNIRIEGDNSDINDYLLLTNSHDGSGAVVVTFTPIRVICQNTLNAALRKAKNKLVFKHTLNVSRRMDLTNEVNFERAAEVLKFHEKFKRHFIEDLENLRRIKMKAVNDMNRIIASIFLDEKEMAILKDHYYNIESVSSEDISTRKKNTIVSCMDSVESGVGQETNRGTGLWLYNGISCFNHNTMNYKSSVAEYDSINDGIGYKRLQKMHDLILEYA